MTRFLETEASGHGHHRRLHARRIRRKHQTAAQNHPDDPSRREAVDKLVAQLAPLLDEGDIIIDGGNSNFNDSIRRTQAGRSAWDCSSWARASAAARRARATDHRSCRAARRRLGRRSSRSCRRWRPRSPMERPCCDWVGEGGAGHFVKMVHNGIEYGDMQLICEAYHLMSAGAGLGRSGDQRRLQALEPRDFWSPS